MKPCFFPPFTLPLPQYFTVCSFFKYLFCRHIRILVHREGREFFGSVRPSSVQERENSYGRSIRIQDPGSVKQQKEKTMAFKLMQQRKANAGAQRRERAATGGQSASMKLLMRELPGLMNLHAITDNQLRLLFQEDGQEDSLYNLRLKVSPTDGLWEGGAFDFELHVPQDYPFERTRVDCATQIYHPNIDAEGHVCLNILREDFNPSIHLEEICQGLLFLFKNPNPDSPLNDTAAKEMIENPQAFERNVRTSVRGGSVHGRKFPGCLATS